MLEDLVRQSIELPGGELSLLQPRVAAELPDAGAVEWAPLAPYWAVLWRSGVALARELDGAPLRGLRVVELGCGLALPSLVAARGGAVALATDGCPEALDLVARNAGANGLSVETARVDWADAGALAARGTFDLVLAADVLYERRAAGALLSLLPRLGQEAWLADPGRPAAEPFVEQARRRWRVETVERGVVSVHRLRIGGCPPMHFGSDAA